MQSANFFPLEKSIFYHPTLKQCVTRNTRGSHKVLKGVTAMQYINYVWSRPSPSFFEYPSSIVAAAAVILLLYIFYHSIFGKCSNMDNASMLT